MQTQMLGSGMANAMQNGPIAAAAAGIPPQDSSEAFFDLLKKNVNGKNSPTQNPLMQHDPIQEFTPRFPGNKVMEQSGLQAKKEGVSLLTSYIVRGSIIYTVYVYV